MSVYRALEQLYETDDEEGDHEDMPESDNPAKNAPTRSSLVSKRCLGQPAFIREALSRGTLNAEIRPATSVVSAVAATEASEEQPGSSADFQDDDAVPLTTDANGKPVVRRRGNFFTRCFAPCGSASP